MPDAKFTIADDFPPVTYDQWRALAAADLNGASLEQKLVTHTYGGIEILPLYTRRDQTVTVSEIGLPGAPPFVRGAGSTGAAQAGWYLRQEHAHPDLSATNRAILEDLEGGVTSILLRLDSAACAGFDPDEPAAAKLVGSDGVAAYSADDLDSVFADAQLPLISVALEAGAAFLPAAAILVELWRRRGVSPDKARGAFNADPLAVLAAEGQLPYSLPTALNLLEDLAGWTAKHYPHVTAVGVNTSVYHNAGATASQDIALAIATGVEYLRAMTAVGMSVDEAARQIQFTFSLGTHHFLAIAKLRAARWLWSRVVEAAGGSSESDAMHINAGIGKRSLTRRDPYVNLLRNAVAVFAAGIAGADSITSVPLDARLGLPNEFSRRIARNTALILQEEAHLHRVVDPAGGSWFLDRLTHEMAEKGWQIFPEIERQGGMTRALTSGWVAEQIAATFAPRAKDFADGKSAIVGVTAFPDDSAPSMDRPILDLAALHKAAALRTANSRQNSASLNKLSASAHPMELIISAASEGASLGQLARAIGFHQEETNIASLPSHNLAEPFE